MNYSYGLSEFVTDYELEQCYDYVIDMPSLGDPWSDEQESDEEEESEING